MLVTTILLALSIFVYYLSANDSKEAFRKRLKSRLGNNAQIFDYYGDSSVTILHRMDAGSLILLPQKSVIISDTLGRILYEYNAEDAAPVHIDQAFINDIRHAGEKIFKIGDRDAVASLYKGQQRQFIVVVTAYDEDRRLRLAQLQKILLSALIIGILLTILVGYIFSSQLIRPIARISSEVNNISSHNLSRRLYSGNSHDELNQLARTFNDLLDRLQESFNTQRRFISNASHELSTPLTSISSQLQVTLNKERTAVEYQRVLQSIQEDVEQMRQLTRSLLEIAKAGGSQGNIELKELRVDEVLLKVIGDVKKINPEYFVEMHFGHLPDDEKQCMVFGNSDLLYSAFRNIIENGCKYSPDKKSLVDVSFESRDILIKVINQGDVISEQEIEQIFQPFYRGKNTTETKGFGLGLPLAKRIIGLHKGTITVHSELDSTFFLILLPSLTTGE